jgi:hypothetical protein
MSMQYTKEGKAQSHLIRNLGARLGGRSTPRSGFFTPGKDSVPPVQEAGWAW